MALKDKWVDRIDGVDIASANDINQVAQAVIELEETGGGNGADGKSAYDIAVINGFEGTEAEWLESLKGEDGAAGTRFIAQAEKPSETDVLWLDTDDDSESGGGTAQPMEKLTFTGAVEAEYDGSEPVTVEIPQGGGGGGVWERVIDFTTEEIVASFSIYLDAEQVEKIKAASRIRILGRGMGIASDEATTDGTINIKLPYGNWTETVCEALPFIPNPNSVSWMTYKDLHLIMERPDSNWDIGGTFISYVSSPRNSIPSLYQKARNSTFKGVSTTVPIVVEATQNMGIGTRFIMEVTQ